MSGCFFLKHGVVLPLSIHNDASAHVARASTRGHWQWNNELADSPESIDEKSELLIET